MNFNVIVVTMFKKLHDKMEIFIKELKIMTKWNELKDTVIKI